MKETKTCLAANADRIIVVRRPAAGYCRGKVNIQLFDLEENTDHKISLMPNEAEGLAVLIGQALAVPEPEPAAIDEDSEDLEDDDE